ncbi:MAG: hypothetical protein V4466_16100 [Pseudomonadota bacterium]
MVGLIKLAPGVVATLLLAACDGGASAVPLRADAARTPTVQAAEASTEASDPREAPVRKIDGKPMWSANRRFTAEQNAERAFRRDGADFGAASVDDFVRKAHAFVTDPPPGVATLTRTNGDTLIYDPKANTFAVATREGAPRTMFKPDEGPAYWETVKAREREGGARRRSGGES